MKKFASIMLALVMAFALMAPAFASTGGETTDVITGIRLSCPVYRFLHRRLIVVAFCSVSNLPDFISCIIRQVGDQQGLALLKRSRRKGGTRF